MPLRRDWIAATLCVATLGPLARADDATEELAKFQGTWQLISAETDGKALAKEQAGRITVTIAGDTHTVRFGDQVVAKGVKFAVDPSKSPKEVTDTVTEGPAKGQILKGIYWIEGDTLTSCVAPDGEVRPNEFSAPSGSRRTLRVFRRAKPPGDPTEADLALFQGTWRHESMEVDGKPADIASFRDTPLRIQGNTFTQGPVKGTFTIDATKPPRTIDLTFTDGDTKGLRMQGIYELDATTYKLCVAGPGADRPKRFDSKSGDGGSVQVLKRARP